MYKIISGMLVTFVSAQALAQVNSVAFVSVPTLDDVGFVVLSVLVAVAAGFAVRNRKK